jgi:PPOX class probable F420-dependent enzyme
LARKSVLWGNGQNRCNQQPRSACRTARLRSSETQDAAQHGPCTYPGRAKTKNIKRNPAVSVCVLSDEWNAAWVQIDGTAEVLDMPEAEDALVDYFRSIAGEHSDWDEYRAAMRLQNKSLIRITPTRWGPVATGGFPADIATKLDAQDG